MWEYDEIPDVRDGFTKKERIVLKCLHDLQNERKGRNVPTIMLYGRVLELIDISEDEFQAILNRWVKNKDL